MSETKQNAGPSGAPQVVTGDVSNPGPGLHAWYYESKRGIELIVEVRDSNGELVKAPDQVKIPWRMLMKSAARCGQKLPEPTHD